MKKTNKMTPKGIVLFLVLAIVIGLCAMGCSGEGGIQEVLTEEEYTYVNPDESKAEPDEGIVIDGVLDEEVYQNNNWLYLHNDQGNDVNIAMTSYYGEKGMYFVYDVTESVPIYVNLERASYMNSCIEMYFAPSSVTSMGQNSVFEIDMLPTGDMVFKKSNGKGGYVNVATTDDIMAHLGATTKGGEINTEDCYGYCLELFIPWEYMEWVGMDVQAMKESFVYVDPAHITSYNLTGTDTSVDRYWYFFAQQQGATFANVFQYFRFDGTGVLGTVPVEVTGGENCTVEAVPNAIPGMKTTITVKPEDGFAVNSVLINGEEYIQNASYNADGSVELVIRPGEEGLKISAAAEAVSDGTKTLSGTVRLANIQEDTLEGVMASYKGPTGEKPIELDENGSFRLEGLEQGYYTLEIQKEGYQDISRGIYLNRDIDAELVLEFDAFFTQNGSAFVLDEQNSNVVHKFGGTGYIMSNKAYDRFTYEMNIRYDEELAKEADIDAFVQQRTGMRIMFSNGKYWYIDMLKQGDSYIVQYAKHSNSIFGKWTTICELNSAQIAKYTGEEGITLKVVRDGQFAAVYLDGKLLRVEKLGNEYAACTAQLGMESWSANRGFLEIPYSITDKISVYVPGSAFYRGGNWDITGQYAGYVTLPGGGDGGWLNFGEKYVDSDVSIVVRDYPQVETKPDDFRTVIKHTFENGTTASFSVYYDSNGKYVVQSMGDTIFGWKYHYELTEEEIAKLQGDGITLRVVRIGTEISCYLDGKEIASGADLTVDKSGNETGIKANMAATVSIRHYGDKGVTVAVPYEMDAELDYVKVTSVPDAAGNQVELNKDNYVRGDVVILSDGGEGSHYPYAMKVNGEAVTLDAEGKYSFEAVEDEYTVEGEYAERIFYDAEEWNEVRQNDGLLTIPASDGDSYWVYSYRSDYKDFDFKTTLRDCSNAEDNYRGAVRIGFANGQDVAFTITNDRSNDDATTVYELQNMGGTLHSWALPGYTLNEDQTAAIQSEEGLEFRIVRVGDVIDVFIGGEHAHEFDLSAGNVADQGAQIRIRIYGNIGKDVEVPFSISEKTPELVTVKTETDENGTITVTNKNVLPGEKVILTGTTDEGYYCGAVTVDGATTADANADGTYSFVATGKSHTVAGAFYKLIFKDTNANWNVYNQHNGILSYTIPSGAKNTGTVNSYQIYNNVDFTVTLKDVNPSARNFRGGINLDFGGGKWVAFSLTNDGTSGADIYEVQNVNDPMLGWFKPGYLLSAEQVAKIQGDGLTFRIVRVGETADLYIDGQHICEYDLSTMKDGKTPSGVADKTTDVQTRIYGAGGQTGEVPFVLKDSVDLVNVKVSTGANGKVTTDQKTYLPGETVVLTVVGDSGYYHTGLYVNGEQVTVGADGTYSFVATAASYNVTCNFAEGVFAEGNANWNLINQNVGVLAVPATVTGNTGWMQTKDNWNELSLTVKDYAGGTVNEYAVAAQFYFSNGKYATVRLIRNLGSDNYTLQCMNDNIFKNWTNWHTLTAQQAAKVQGEGIELRMTRIGTTLNLYLDDVLVKKLDLTTNDSGVTADMSCVVKLRYYNSNGYDVALPFKLANPEQKVTVNIAGSANGTVTADKVSCLVGETVKLTVKPNSGYCCGALYVDGKAVTLADDGTYSFVASKDTYDVRADFVAAVWNPAKNDGNTWNTTFQSSGILKTSAANADTGWMYTYGNGYRDIALTLQDKTPDAKNFRAAVQFEFTNGKIFRISLTNADSGELGVYKIQTMGSNNIVGNWKTPYRLSDAEVSKLKSGGIQFRVAIVGTTAQIYLDNVMVCSYDLSAGISDEMAALVVRLYGNKGYADTVPYVVGDGSGLVAVNIKQSANGTVTADKNSYKIGDTVTLTVTGDEGYYHTGLYVNGTRVDVAQDGTYSFTAAANSYNVTCDFAISLFNEIDAWNLTNQHVGLLSVPATVTNNTGWMYTKGDWNELSITVKDYSGGTRNEYAAVGSLYFANGKHTSIRLISNTNTGTYVLQSMGDSTFGWTTHYNLTAQQAAKVQGEGIKFTMTRRGTRLDLYLDGVAVVTNLDLTARNSGITAGMTCVARVRYYNFGNAVEMPFELDNPDQNVTLNITAENGTVTTDKGSYLVGETVKLTVKGNDGYYYSGVTVNGQSVEPDWDGNYSFKATESSYDVKATFAPTVFTGGDTRHWDIFKHQVGELHLKSHSSGHSGWIDYTGTCNDVSIVVKDHVPSANDFAMTFLFKFSNGEILDLRIHHTDKDGKYRVQSMKGSNLYDSWVSNYTFSDAETAAVTGDGIKYRVIILNDAAHVYLNDVKVCEYVFKKSVGDATVTVTLRMDGNLNNDVYMTYALKNTTELP